MPTLTYKFSDNHERTFVKVAVWLGKDGMPYCSVADDHHAIASHATIVELVRDTYKSDDANPS